MCLSYTCVWLTTGPHACLMEERNNKVLTANKKWKLDLRTWQTSLVGPGRDALSGLVTRNDELNKGSRPLQHKVRWFFAPYCYRAFALEQDRNRCATGRSCCQAQGAGCKGEQYCGAISAGKLRTTSGLLEVRAFAMSITISYVSDAGSLLALMSKLVRQQPTFWAD